MTSNYGWDANGMEREPFPARDEFATRPNRVVDPKVAAHRRAVAEHPGCGQCADGWGTRSAGPGHCTKHDRHCSAAPCW